MMLRDSLAVLQGDRTNSQFLRPDQQGADYPALSHIFIASIGPFPNPQAVCASCRGGFCFVRRGWGTAPRRASGTGERKPPEN